MAPKSSSKRPRDRPHARPKAGVAGPGKTVDPTRAAEERGSEMEAPDQPRGTPAPGVPVSNERYEWLKRKAKTVRTPRSAHSQEDPSGGKSKK
jgi:hypothetical protein